MKIAYIANLTIPSRKASGYQITKMCEEFASQGVDVTLYVPTRQREIETDICTHYGLKKNFELVRLRSYDALRWHPYIGTLSFHLQSALFLFRLCLLRLPKDTVVYSRQPEIVWLFGLRGYKTVFEVHRISEQQLGVFQFFTRRAKKIVCVTHGLSDLYQKKVRKTQCLVAPDGVDLSLFDIAVSKEAAREEMHLSAKGAIAGYFGQFKTMGMTKGIDTILSALTTVPDITVLCVGGTDKDIAWYSKQATALGVAERVHFVGQVTRAQLAVYQKACDMLLMPFPNTNHFAHFMSPLKMFEYMASKRPIIATDLPSIREVLQDGKNALLIPPEDAAALAGAMRALRTDPALTDTLVAHASADVQQYEWRNRAAHIIAFIQSNQQ